MGCCVDFLKFLVFSVNFVAWAVFGVLLSGCVFLLLQSKQLLGFHIEPNLNQDNPTALYFSLILILITIFGFLFIFTFLGCCGAACVNRCMLGSFTIILLIFLGANVGAIAFMFTQFKDELALVTAELKMTIPYYDVEDRNSIVRLMWDFLQPQMRCCGSESWRDWALAEGLKPGRKVPASCCLPGRESDCVYQPEATNAFVVGCVEKLEMPIRIAFWALPALMFTMLVFTMCVCARSGRSRDDDYEEDYDRRGGRGKRSRGRGRRDSRASQYSEETGYVYQQSPPNQHTGGAAYTSSPPYNPAYNSEGYPTGVIHPPSAPAEYQQPLIQPPAYHDVVYKNNKAYNNR